jgi:ribosomal protein L24E
MSSTPTSGGYWMVASDGGIFTFGDAKFYGSTGNIPLAQPVVGMARTSDGKGYWLVASDGGVFTFGDAKFYGSTANVKLAAPVVGIVPTSDGKGYWLVASDGGIFTFGDAGFVGSLGGERHRLGVADSRRRGIPHSRVERGRVRPRRRVVLRRSEVDGQWLGGPSPGRVRPSMRGR